MESKKETDEAALNRAYFLTLRTVAVKSIPEACTKFGVDIQFAKQVGNMTMNEIERLALSDIVVFKPAIEPQQFLRIAGIDNHTHRHIVARLSINH